jgi:hypothetical protein
MPLAMRVGGLEVVERSRTKRWQQIIFDLNVVFNNPILKKY